MVWISRRIVHVCQHVTECDLDPAYEAMTPGSAALAAEARGCIVEWVRRMTAGHLDPYPIYIQRASGPVKWDVNGNRYVDYFGGHGSRSC